MTNFKNIVMKILNILKQNELVARYNLTLIDDSSIQWHLYRKC